MPSKASVPPSRPRSPCRFGAGEPDRRCRGNLGPGRAVVLSSLLAAVGPLPLRSAWLLLGPLMLLAGRAPSGRIRHVPADYPGIQVAIDSAAPGDTVLVEPGRYVENIQFRGKGIVVASR